MKAKTLRTLCIYMLCLSSAVPEDIDPPLFRLAGLSSRCQGVVQVWIEKMWHSLCDTALNIDLSAHICRKQKCGKPVLQVTEQEVNASSPFLNFTCGLMENWRNCSFSHVADDECSNAAFLNCAEQPVLRISGTHDPCAGRVEIFKDGFWGSVCHDGWDAMDAEITCKQMKCGSALSALGGSYFGSGHPQIHLNEVKCTGSENSLWECPANGTRECSTKEHAGVVCSDHRDVRLSGGANNCSGRVEVYLNGVWATVCDSHWYTDDSVMLCRYLGCGPFQKETKHEHSLSTYAAFLCREAKSLWDCIVYKKAHICPQSKALGLICQGADNDSSVIESWTISYKMTSGLPQVDAEVQYLVIACAVLGALLLASIIIFSVIVLRLQKQKKMPLQIASLPRNNDRWMSMETKTPDFSLQISTFSPSPRLQSKDSVPASIPLVPTIITTMEDKDDYGSSDASLMPLVTFRDSVPKQQNEMQAAATAKRCDPDHHRRPRSASSSSTSSEEQNWYENYRQQVGQQNSLFPPQPYEGSSEYDDVSSVTSD
ncbi:T-cell differentiation antigen CD6-like isoform X2 [Dendrobates tinctorius]|uniref:T-cell differentiation antigen CD6-like isoform X2 n=1 Tax=Dendrobates tinctorius TaxID=92724 RepID=UPI003CC96FE6